MFVLCLNKCIHDRVFNVTVFHIEDVCYNIISIVLCTGEVLSLLLGVRSPDN